MLLIHMLTIEIPIQGLPYPGISIDFAMWEGGAIALFSTKFLTSPPYARVVAITFMQTFNFGTLL